MHNSYACLRNNIWIFHVILYFQYNIEKPECSDDEMSDDDDDFGGGSAKASDDPAERKYYMALKFILLYGLR